MLSPEFLSQLERLTLAARRTRQGLDGGLSTSRRHGRTNEFSGHRPYSPGDEPRFIDWNAYGRCEALYCKQFFAEESFTLHIILDTSASMTAKFAYAMDLTAALAYVALVGGNRVRIAAPDATGNCPTRIFNSKNAYPDAEIFLRRLRPAATYPLERLVETPGISPADRAGTAVILSDFLATADFARIFAPAECCRIDFLALQLLDPQEINPRLPDFFTIEGLEEASSLNLSNTPDLQHHYAEAFNRHVSNLQDACRAHRVNFLQIATDTDLLRAVLDVLRCGALIR